MGQREIVRAHAGMPPRARHGVKDATVQGDRSRSVEEVARLEFRSGASGIVAIASIRATVDQNLGRT
jgi:hypothetical protein